MSPSRTRRLAVAICYTISAAAVVGTVWPLLSAAPTPAPKFALPPVPEPIRLPPGHWVLTSRSTDAEVAVASDQLGFTSATAIDLKLPHGLRPIAVRLDDEGRVSAALFGPADATQLPAEWPNAKTWTVPAREPGRAYLIATFTPTGASR